MGGVGLTLVADVMSAEVGNAEEEPEDEGGDHHGEDGSGSDLFDHAVIEAEPSDDKAAEEIFHKEIEKDGNASESGREIPLPCLEKGPDALHEKAHEGVKNDGVAEF
ncbi:MAG: hypothetical protein ACJAQT_000791 [Akkermansiaceae bacterium]|jgi:hypothetical protein